MTARGVRFLLGFNMYRFLAQCEQAYLFLALALLYYCYKHVSCELDRGWLILSFEKLPG